MRIISLLLMYGVLGWAQQPGWRPLFNGKNLDGWEVRGECAWEVVEPGILFGQRLIKNTGDPFGVAWPVSKQQYEHWLYHQAWIYTKAEFGEYDLHVEYWLPHGVNSGVSIRDRSRAHTAIREADTARPELAAYPKTTPAHIGYEIQIIDDDREKYQTGSIYTFVPARTGAQKMGQWNAMDIESRNEAIRVRVNGQLVAEYPGEAGRSKTGPIGFQLHDQFTFLMLRDLRIREINAAR
jgi:hypothetical protein